MLYLVTNRKLIGKNNIYNIIQDATEAGIDAVILREKDLSSDELYQMGMYIKKILSKNNIPLIINSNIEVANRLNASGIQVSFVDFLNKNINFNGKIGVSIHSINEAILSERLGASYVLAGHIFNTTCKPNLDPKGIDFIRELRKNIDIPIICIGGINKYNIRKVYESGASGAAVMSLIMQAENVSKTVKELKGALYNENSINDSWIG
ncbi:thiamine-phosphate pyrophosphorylase [Alkalithermobacter thermoalcaliphilus JW-YL-7 = DSM 7308]|uniref:Thiamine-phosphate diphosphorylase n=1 Tax=Alkalithermobacter thermoalcaliphilus JW-YL-7 = DSM 7308 TaxID=1121328 RepID=A0A150FNX5_CLOPD|nr:Thiamine-phosphate diphosphorylase [[Clostridium] paradoxum JW-YL-7 = DSM 7308]SHK55668.1 thiamine-phosphate pyrophosphorylase [[Clostridium] paradoxum JW-YL-7 = DSM 7308]